MRYIKLNPAAEEEVEGSKMILSTKDMLNQLMCAESQLTSEQLFRLHDLYKKLNDAKDGDVFEIEDQDYTILSGKVEPFVRGFRGAVMKFSMMINFLKLIKNLPTSKPEAE